MQLKPHPPLPQSMLKIFGQHIMVFSLNQQSHRLSYQAIKTIFSKITTYSLQFSGSFCFCRQSQCNPDPNKNFGNWVRELVWRHWGWEPDNLPGLCPLLSTLKSDIFNNKNLSEDLPFLFPHNSTNTHHFENKLLSTTSC